MVKSRGFRIPCNVGFYPTGLGMEWDACLFKILETEQRGIMGFSKLPLFLVLSMLIIHQAGMLQAAPFRSVWKNGLVPATLTEEESYFLLATMVKYYVQKASELEYETEDFGIIAQERTSNAATGMTHKMAGFLGKSGSKIKRNIMSTNVAPKPLAGTTGIFRTK
uniref:Uncharacterized protein n=1 Tax=Bos taurus TaxID=9913 RepID=A0AAA9TMA4_BOVIN